MQGAQSANRRVVVALLRLAWPLMLVPLLGMLDGALTRYWLGECLGSAGLAVHAVAHPATGGFQLIFVSVAIGCSVLVARSVGAGDGQGLTLTFSATLLIAAVWAALACVLLPAMPWISERIAGQGVGADELARFLTPWLVLVVPFQSLMFLLVTTAASAGWTRFALIQAILHLSLYAALLPLSLRVLDLGFAAPAVAMGTSLLVNSVCLGRSLLARSSENGLGDRIDWVRGLSWRKWRRMIDIGVPPQFASMLSWAFIAAATARVALSGSVEVVGFGIGVLFLTLLNSATYGLARATQVQLAQHLGGQRGQKARVVLKVGIALQIAASCALCLACAGLAEPFSRLFTSNPAAVDAAVVSTRILAVALIPISLWQVLIAAFAAVGAAKLPSLMIVVSIPMAVMVAELAPLRASASAAISLLVLYGIGSLLLSVLATHVLWRGALGHST